MKGFALYDLTLLVAPPLALGLLVTAHVAIVLGLVGRTPRWRAAAAFLLPPLAPLWGMKAEQRGWSCVWLGAAAAYAVSLALALVS